MKLLREPLVHFLVIGAGIFVLYGFFRQQDVAVQERTITISAAEVNWLTETWQKRWNRPPTEEERAGLIEQYLREMILYREALVMGLDQDDIVIRRRLAQKLEFLSQDLLRTKSPSKGELRAYFETHIDRYLPPDLITLTHVFLDPDLRGNEALTDAETIKTKLNTLKEPPQDPRSFGDRLMLLQSYYPERSEAELSRLFGSGFAQSVFEFAPRQWHGPVLSGYGVHLVYVHDRQETDPPIFSEVEEQVLQDWESDKREQINEQFIANLLARYDVTIEDAPIEELSPDAEVQAP